jgi:hypothetical protein
MSADYFVFRTLIADHPDPATASRALAMAEAAVLRRAADAINALPQDYECDPGWGDAAERLRRTADGIEEKATAPAAPATPGPTGRVAQLLDAIRTGRGRWTTVRAAQFYRDNGIEPPGAQWSRTRTVARGDLRDLAVWGHLTRHEEPGRQYYTLKTRKDVRP